MKFHRELEHKLNMLKEKYGETSDQYSMEYEMYKCVQELLDVLSNQGHSGFSVGYCVNIFKTLVDGRVLSPLTGDDSEWNEVPKWDKERKCQQNKRMSSVFRENFDNSTAYDINGRAFTDDGGKSWYTTGRTIDGVKGNKPITFPYIPQVQKERYYVEEQNGKEVIVKTENVEVNNEGTKA